MKRFRVRRIVVEAVRMDHRLLMTLERELREGRADWNQDRFRRVMRTRAKAVSKSAWTLEQVQSGACDRLGNCAGAIMPTWPVTSIMLEMAETDSGK